MTEHGRLVAALELVSPRNKDRHSARATYLARYLTYLHQGANLLLVDVHPAPLQFSFPDALAEQLSQSPSIFRRPTSGRLRTPIWPDSRSSLLKQKLKVKT